MNRVVQIHHPDGSFEQIFPTTRDELRKVLATTTAGAPKLTRGRLIGGALTDTATTPIAVGGGRTVGVVDRAVAYRHDRTAARSAELPLETRRFSGTEHGTRVASGTTSPASTGRTMVGYAVVWDAEYPITDRSGTFLERFARGAFLDSLKVRTPIAQFDHGAHPTLGSLPLTRYESVYEDSRGLRVQGDIAEGWLLDPIADAIRDGRVNGMSIRFAVRRERWSRNRDDRTILAADLVEAGPVVMPASPTTSVTLRDKSKVRSRAQRTAIAQFGLDRK